MKCPLYFGHETDNLRDKSWASYFMYITRTKWPRHTVRHVQYILAYHATVTRNTVHAHSLLDCRKRAVAI